MSSNLLVPMLILVLVFGVLIFLVILKAGKPRSGFDKKAYQSAWLKIENSLDRNNAATFAMAILEADKLLDQALRELQLPGETMGDRLKHGKDKFQKPSLDKVWQAHRLRNRIAHEAGVTISYAQAKIALASIKRGLKELGAI